MLLDAAKRIRAPQQNNTLRELFESEENFVRWVEHPASTILHHDRMCCEEARMWFLAYARSMEIGTGAQYGIKAPTWLSKLFEWGPSEWPISWCQVVQEKVIDCGVFAALAREVFRAQGHEAHPAQALLSYNSECTDHWQRYWDERKKKKKRKDRDLFPWIGKQLVYHEICVLELPDGSAKFYDSTWGNWYLPQPRMGFGALLALRSECPRILSWGEQTITCGEWIDL